jgi:exo-1,4-beta-D-glucosaminidase
LHRYTETNTNNVGTAFGFATEISPGAAPLTLDSMKKTVAANQMWDPSSPDGGPTDDWNYHCGAATGAFGSLKHFTPSVVNRIGNSSSAADYLAKAQLEAYESHRAMFEAYVVLHPLH